MKAGIFARTFQRKTVAEVCHAVSGFGFEVIQFNMACAGLPSMPEQISDAKINEIKRAITTSGLQVCGVSGTYNMCHPDPNVRRDGLRRLELLAGHCQAIGTNLISLCTGTRDPDDKWSFHPENASAEAWMDMMESMESAVQIAEKYRIFLGVEPEHANVVSNIDKATQLLQEMQSKQIKIILDPANLFEQADLTNLRSLIDEAIDRLGHAIIMAHAKDRKASGEFAAPGKGMIPFDYLVKQLEMADIDVPIIAHGFHESETSQVAKLLQRLCS